MDATTGPVLVPSCCATKGTRGDSFGTYMCADLSCHENVRLAHPLAPNEVRTPGQVDFRLDGTRRRMESFVSQVWERV